MIRRVGVIGALASALFVLAAVVSPAQAGTYTLHPSGFGDHTYASWKGQEGLPDSVGAADTALYLQKHTLTATFAAAVARIEGFEGVPVSELDSVEFWWQTDGHCGAGAPRFNITTEEGPTYFVGCAAMTAGGDATDDEGDAWEQRTFEIPDEFVGHVASIAIVFDEGSDIGEGHVYLDDIRVDEKTWTGPMDNGNR